jgi:hypothetical protein
LYFAVGGSLIAVRFASPNGGHDAGIAAGTGPAPDYWIFPRRSVALRRRLKSPCNSLKIVNEETMQ